MRKMAVLHDYMYNVVAKLSIANEKIIVHAELLF